MLESYLFSAVNPLKGISNAKTYWSVSTIFHILQILRNTQLNNPWDDLKIKDQYLLHNCLWIFWMNEILKLKVKKKLGVFVQKKGKDYKSDRNQKEIKKEG